MGCLGGLDIPEPLTKLSMKSVCQGFYHAIALPHLPPVYSLSRIMIDEFVKSSRTQ